MLPAADLREVAALWACAGAGAGFGAEDDPAVMLEAAGVAETKDEDEVRTLGRGLGGAAGMGHTARYCGLRAAGCGLRTAGCGQVQHC